MIKPRHEVFTLAGIALALILLRCTEPNAQTAAELMTALATKIPFPSPVPSGTPSPQPLPGEVSCNSDVFQLQSGSSGQSVTFTTTVIDTSAYPTLSVDLAANLNVTGPNISAPIPSTTGTTSLAPSFVCSFEAEFAYDSKFAGLTGSGTIPTCSHFECIVNGEKVSCEDVQTAMATTTCY